MAIENKNLLKELINKYGQEKIVVSIDAINKKVATHGWEKLSDIDSVDLCKELEQIGVKTIVYTDISKDGMLKDQTSIYTKNYHKNLTRHNSIRRGYIYR